MNVMIEMTALCLSRPRRGADPGALAAWYAAKARLHEHLAGQGGPDCAEERRLAESARKRASSLAAAAGDWEETLPGSASVQRLP
ncbi:hypothetical protein [Nocardia cyriacigeorgica]|uniref:hypothetical protein n=1 Tax=Nocardia cyriacigeorgica TaxID=135487 RepID=UPI0013D39039|nr:hypothetical protein [Nocardia cyriacigeorgica]NEW26647.1 hypothetical protein [Nocardia cyriacigeorgica]